MKFRPLALLSVVGLAASTSLAQTDIPWAAAADGLWSNAANWTGSNIPNAADERAVLALPGLYTATVDAGYTVYGVSILNPSATILIADARALSISGGANAFSNQGTLVVNTGGGNGTVLTFNSSTTATGSGSIRLSASGNLDTAYINTIGAAVLTNSLGHTIRGTGRIYGTLLNEGLVSADQPGTTLQLLSAAKTNNRDITAVGTSNLSISGITLTQGASGRLLASDGTVTLNGATIVGGSLQSSGSGIVRVSASNATLVGVTNAGQMLVEDARGLGVNDGLINTGAITVNTQGGNGTLIQFNNSGPLSGAGNILLNASGNLDTAYINTAGAAVITHAAGHTIHGAGNIYASITNNGLISADQPGRNLQLLSAPKTNASVISAVNDGTLILAGFTLTQTTGGLIRNDSSTVNFGGCTLTGGAIQTLGDGITQIVGGNATFTSVTNQGPLHINDGRLIGLNNGLTNQGVVHVNPQAGGNGTYLQFNNNGTLSGNGDIALNASSNLDTATINTVGAAVATNGPEQIIRGTGNISGTLVNDGEIRADLATKALRLNGSPKTNSTHPTK